MALFSKYFNLKKSEQPVKPDYRTIPRSVIINNINEHIYCDDFDGFKRKLSDDTDEEILDFMISKIREENPENFKKCVEKALLEFDNSIKHNDTKENTMETEKTVEKETEVKISKKETFLKLLKKSIPAVIGAVLGGAAGYVIGAKPWVKEAEAVPAPAQKKPVAKPAVKPPAKKPAAPNLL